MLTYTNIEFILFIHLLIQKVNQVEKKSHNSNYNQKKYFELKTIQAVYMLRENTGVI